MLRKLFGTLLALLLATPLLAQQGTTDLRGRVVDAQGGALPGVTVVVRNQATGMYRETLSSEDGSFIASSLVPGTYEATASLQEGEPGSTRMAKAKRLSFPASTMDRVLACPGSVALEATVPRKETFFTDEGHAAHTLAQWALTDGGFDTRKYLGRVIVEEAHKGTPQATRFEFPVDEKMCAYVQEYVDSVKARLDAYNADKKVKTATLYIEKRIDTSPVLGVPGQSGIADTLIVVEYKDGTGKISVEDLKYGAKVAVEAKDNPQLLTYGAGALEMFGKDIDITEIDLVIHMPRMKHFSRETVDAKDLRAYAKTAKAGVAESLREEKLYQIQGIGALTLNPGDDPCRFCRAKKICPAFNAAAKKNVVARPIPLKKKPPTNPRY